VSILLEVAAAPTKSFLCRPFLSCFFFLLAASNYVSALRWSIPQAISSPAFMGE
jgi:hypothetical protein